MYILKVYSIHYTLRSNTNVKKISLDKIKSTKNVLFFLLQTLTHHITFDLQLLYELKYKVHLSKTVWGFSFSIMFRFYLNFYFCSTKCTDSLTLKHNPFQNEDNGKATHSFAPRPLIFKFQLEVLKFNNICMTWSSPKTDQVTHFLNPENRSFENMSIVTFK